MDVCSMLFDSISTERSASCKQVGGDMPVNLKDRADSPAIQNGTMQIHGQDDEQETRG